MKKLSIISLTLLVIFSGTFSALFHKPVHRTIPRNTSGGSLDIRQAEGLTPIQGLLREL